MSLASGTKLGPYEIVALLGSGGMGEVYRAQDTRLDREVAIKVVRHSGADDARLAERFEREAKVLAALSHPHLLAIYDYGRQEGMAYLVTELLKGRTLAAQLKEGRLDVSSALAIACETAEGLAAAHGRGIIHRDLKPGNVFLTEEGHAKILDFGLARLTASAPEGERLSEADTEERPTRPGTILGTAGYMAPEQVQGAPADARTDVFALGILVYEMVAGKRPFQGGTDPDLLAAVLRDRPAPLDSLDGKVPRGLAEVVARCLEKDPPKRYPSAREAALALNALRSASGIAPGVVPLRRAWVALASALGLAAVLALAWALWHGAGARRNGLPDFQPRQITSRPGLEGTPAISPDGRAVAYSVSTESGTELWVADVRGGAPLRLASAGPFSGLPTWLPDGSALLYVSWDGRKSVIMKVARFGGSPSLVVENASDPAVSSDGKLVAFARSENGGYSRVWTGLLGDPSAARRLTGDGDGVWNHVHPSWSPDGRFICYNDQTDLWVAPLAGGRAARLTHDDVPDQNPVWSPDGRHIYFSSIRDGPWAIWRVPARGGAPERVTIGTGSEDWPSLSSDGTRLAYGTKGQRTCSLIDRATRGVTALSGGVYAGEPSFSPDGAWLAFTSAREAALNIWKVPLRDGRLQGEPEPVTDQSGICANAAFSPDGRWIAYHRVLEGRRHIWVAAADAGIPVPFTSGPYDEDQPEWSPDGTRLSFLSNQGGRDGIWVAPFGAGRPAGEPRQVVKGMSAMGVHCWLKDGSALAFIGDDGSGMDIWTAGLSGEAAPVRLTRGAGASWLTADPSNGDLLAVGTWGASSRQARRVSVRNGASSSLPELADGERESELLELEASRDGRFLVVIEVKNEGDVWMLMTAGGRF